MQETIMLLYTKYMYVTRFMKKGLTHVIKPRPIMLKFLPIMFLSNAHKNAYYVQYYAHNHIANNMPQFICNLIFFMTRLAYCS